MSSTMTLTHVQPRRRAARASDTPAALPQTQTPSLDIDLAKDFSVRKGATFHQPKSPASHTTNDPIINIKNLPSRSLTCPKTLEDLQQQSDKLVDNIVASFDQSLSGLGRPVLETQTATTKDADSHTGMSMRASAHISHADSPKVYSSVYKPVGSKSTFRSNHVLSEYAAKVIKLHIIDPLLAEATLKDFHPLVKGLPARIGTRQIKCLRDLEKCLIFLAPHTAKSARSYLDFCETSIQCIVSTVDHLGQTDQRRPNDRPYTNNYFVDLVEQVRQYARIMAVSRAKKEKGIALDPTSDIQPLVPTVIDDSKGNALLTLVSGEKVLLRGGVSNDGKPIELVREVDGKFVPIKADHIDLDGDMFDDDVTRSMARKRKCDIGKIEYRACRECGKVYTRPCDLTKHEKTHSRPWKCSDEGCKYFEFGWPTEKERDRHMNDKHSSAPALYHCLWKDEGCTYTSKRESNCKQHMEKAHGWDYVRSKSKKGAKLVASAVSPSASLMPVATPGSDRLSTPALTASSNQSPVQSTYDSFSPAASASTGFSRDGSMSSYHPSTYAPSPSDPVFSFNDYSKGFSFDGFLSPVASESQDRFLSGNLDTTSPSTDMNMDISFEQEFGFNNVNTDWNTLGSLFPQYQIPQQPTPMGSDFGFDLEIQPLKAAEPTNIGSEFSPGASSTAMLFGTEDFLMQDNQGFPDFAAQAKAGQQQTSTTDFTLFGSPADTAAMYPDLAEGSQFDQEMGSGMFEQMSEEEMDRYLYGDAPLGS